MSVREGVLMVAAVVTLLALLGFARILRPVTPAVAWALLAVGVLLGLAAVAGP